MAKAILIKDTRAQLGEGAIWNHKTNELFYVDIEGRNLHVLNPENGDEKVYPVKERIGTVVPTSEGAAVVALENGIHILDLDSGTLTLLCDPEKHLDNIRMNDGKCDPGGRLWVGSMHLEHVKNAASLYRIEKDGTCQKMLDDITISNGIIWSLDHKTMYYIDTPALQVRAFDFDKESGDISNGRVIIEVPENMGYPDGMTIDDAGKLWIALWNGNAVSRWDPASGKLLEKIEVPAHNVSSCAFGGRNLDELYITSARVDMSVEELKKWPLSGSVFKVVPGVKGVASHFFGN